VIGALFEALKVRTWAKWSTGAPGVKNLESTWALNIQTFFLVYGFSSGELLSASYTFVPYLLAVAAVYSLRRLRSGAADIDVLSNEPQSNYQMFGAADRSHTIKK
jgi:hypothetical protein